MPLSYEDVRTVLALIDGHTQGTAHFVDGDLSVTVRGPQADPLPPAQSVARLGRTVCSPAVGRLSIAGPSAVGTRVDGGTVLASVLTAGRDTPVIAGDGGFLIAFHAEDGDFVEYGQALATIAGEDTV